MNNDIVKPMPANAPAPASCRHEYASGFCASPNRTASAEAAMKPTGLPITSPAPMASNNEPWPLKTLEAIATPAFASAKIGNTR
jgi:hypothetical protein